MLDTQRHVLLAQRTLQQPLGTWRGGLSVSFETLCLICLCRGTVDLFLLGGGGQVMTTNRTFYLAFSDVRKIELIITFKTENHFVLRNNLEYTQLPNLSNQLPPKSNPAKSTKMPTSPPITGPCAHDPLLRPSKRPCYALSTVPPCRFCLFDEKEQRINDDHRRKLHDMVRLNAELHAVEIGSWATSKIFGLPVSSGLLELRDSFDKALRYVSSIAELERCQRLESLKLEFGIEGGEEEEVRRVDRIS